MDKLQWFKFSYADWRMGKIQRCPEVTQARFLNLCCLYWSKDAELSLEDAEIEIDKEHLDVLISKKIIETDGECIFIKFLDEQLKGINETSKGKSKAAKVRWDKYRQEKENANAMHVHKSAMQNNAEKRREEKIRETQKSVLTFSEFWILYDKATGKKKTEVKYKTVKEYDRAFIKNFLPKYKISTPEKRYRKDPLTFLNGEHWHDTIEYTTSDINYNSPIEANPYKNYTPPTT